MIGKIVGWSLLALIAFAGWQVGGALSTDALGMALGIIFGLMAGIPAALIAYAASNRPQEPQKHVVDIYHHNAKIATAQLDSLPTRAITQVQPQKYQVIDESRVIVLPVATQSRIEVSG
jgi:hypothetical protein